ncbi:MAG: hypothetical protein ACI8QC_002735 [Planctomycetota bacterium]
MQRNTSSSPKTVRTVLLLGALGLSLGACRTAHMPRPLDPVSDEWEEEDGAERKDWIGSLHGTAPGVDWRAIERASDESERARRAEHRKHGRAQSAPGTWREVGSRNQSGQTRCATLTPSGELLLGSANGGLWAGNLEGQGWRPLSDDLGGGVDEVLAFDQDGAEVLLLRRGADVFRSADGGESWDRALGLGRLMSARRWVRLPAQGEHAAMVLLLGTSVSGNGMGSYLQTTLFGSVDGGESFTSRWRSDRAWNGDLAWKAEAQELWLLHAGGLLRSSDLGLNFKPVALLDGLAKEGRLVLSDTRAYGLLLGEDGFALHSYEDFIGQRRLAEMENCFGTLGVLSGRQDTVFVGGMELLRSTDSGANFESVNSWTAYYDDPLNALHADVRGFDSFVDAQGENLLLAHTDGGSYLSRDRGHSWINLCARDLGVGQVYDTLTDRGQPQRLAMGTQDQGYQVGLVEASAGRGPSTDTEQLLSGDYAYLVSGDGTHERIFASYPDFMLIATGAQNTQLKRSPWPRNSKHAWMPPLVADPSDSGACFMLGDKLYRFSPAGSGRYRAKPFGAGRFDLRGANFLTAMAFSPADMLHVVAADDSGARHVSRDGGLTWTRAKDDGAQAEGFRPTVVAGHPNQSEVFVVAGSGYGGASVRISADGGTTWERFDAGLPATLVLDLCFADEDTLYAATEAGPYRWRRELGRWEALAGESAPCTTYWSVEFLPSSGAVRFGTYGRGVWDFSPQMAPEALAAGI